MLFGSGWEHTVQGMTSQPTIGQVVMPWPREWHHCLSDAFACNIYVTACTRNPVCLKTIKSNHETNAFSSLNNNGFFEKHPST